MERYRVRRTPVVNKAGIIIGMVAQADIALNANSDEAAELLRALSEEEELLEASMPMGSTYAR